MAFLVLAHCGQQQERNVFLPTAGLEDQSLANVCNLPLNMSRMIDPGSFVCHAHKHRITFLLLILHKRVSTFLFVC